MKERIKKIIGYANSALPPRKGKVQDERLKRKPRFNQCLRWLNQQLLPKASPNLANLTNDIRQQLLVPKPPNHIKEQGIRRNLFKRSMYLEFHFSFKHTNIYYFEAYFREPLCI